MKAKDDEIMQTTPVRIDNDILSLVRNHKTATGIPIGRFIEDAIVEKIAGISDEVKSKIGLNTLKLKKESNKKKK